MQSINNLSDMCLIICAHSDLRCHLIPQMTVMMAKKRGWSRDASKHLIMNCQLRTYQLTSFFQLSIQVGRWDKDKNRFIQIQNLVLPSNPVQVKFHNTGDRLYLTALYGGHDTHISSHVYGGALGFMHEEEKVKIIELQSSRFLKTRRWFSSI